MLFGRKFQSGIVRGLHVRMKMNRRQKLMCAAVIVMCLFIVYSAVYNSLSLDLKLSHHELFHKLPNVHQKCLDRSLLLNGATVFKMNTNKPHKVDFRIIVITYNRGKSLRRLLNSLNEAHYFGDKVVLDVWIDRADITNLINNAVYTTAKNFSFKHGDYHIHRRDEHVGLYGQWLCSWFPWQDPTEIVVFLEDDLTVSPYFYKWLKAVHRKYDRVSTINGYALQGERIKHGGAVGPLSVPLVHPVFLYPVLGTWGFSPNKRNWLSFLEWFNAASMKRSFQPLVPGIVSSNWYKQHIITGKTHSMWSMWHIYFAWNNSEVTLYPNYSEQRGFTFNWREAGLHFSAQPSLVSNTDGLITQWREEFDRLPDTPILLNSNGKKVGYLQVDTTNGRA